MSTLESLDGSENGPGECVCKYRSRARVRMRYVFACLASIGFLATEFAARGILRRLACAADKNAGVKRPGYEANNFRVPCRGSAVAVHS